MLDTVPIFVNPKSPCIYAVGEEASRQPRSDRRVRSGGDSNSAALVQRFVDAGTRGDGVAEPVSFGREQGAYNECGCGEVANIRAEKRDEDLEAARGVSFLLINLSFFS